MKPVYYESVYLPSSVPTLDGCHVRLIRSPDSRYDTTLHWHDALELVFIINGSVNYISDNIHYTTTAGHAHLINSKSIHAATNGTPYEEIYSLVILISDVYLSTIAPDIVHPAFQLDRNSPFYGTILQIMQDIIPVVENNCPNKHLFISWKLNQLLYLLYEHCQIPAAQAKNIYSKEIVYYVGKHYSENITLNSISEHFGLQKNYFCRIFKKETGLSFKYYLNRIRLDAALSLLATKKHTALECALQSGFSSEKVLIDWCKKIYNTTPTKYVKSSSMPLLS